MDWDKENNIRGCPSKLSACDKQSFICQITTGKLDNAVEATHFINIIPTPVHPQTVRRTLKDGNFQAIIKKKHPLFKKAHWLACLNFARYHENWTVKD